MAEVVGGCISSSDWDLGKETSHEKFDYATCRPCLFFGPRPRSHLDRPRTHATIARIKSQQQPAPHCPGTCGHVILKPKFAVDCLLSATIKATRGFASGYKTFTTAANFNCPDVARARRSGGQPVPVALPEGTAFVRGKPAHPSRIVARMRPEISRDTLVKALDGVEASIAAEPNANGWLTVNLSPSTAEDEALGAETALLTRMKA